MARWTVAPIFDSYLLVAVVIGCLLLLLLVGPSHSGLSVRRRGRLLALRLLVILLLALAMLRPTWIHVDKRRQTATIVFLLDQSRSMNVPDAAGRSRWIALRETLGGAQKQIDALRENYEVRGYLYDSHARPIEDENDAWSSLPQLPGGDQSDMGAAIDDVLRAEAGKRLAAIVLLGDGAQRVIEPQIELQQPVREIARRGCPLICVPFGESRDQSQVRDVAVQNLPDQYTVFINNELAIRALLQIRGYAGRAIPAELLVTDPDGKTELMGPTSTSVEGQDEPAPVEFTWIPRRAGQYRLRLRVPPQTGEQVTENNELSSFVTVLDGGLRVLLIDGNLGWQESKFIRRSLDESPDIQLDVLLDTRGNKTEPLVLPDRLEKDYDVIILSDIDADALGDQNALTLANAVGNGKGLMMLGGVQSFGPGGYARSPLQPVIPVLMERVERQIPGAPIRLDVHLQGELTMVPTRDYFVTRLTAPLENATRWAQLPPLLGANRLRGLKPGAEALLETSDGQPLLVRGQFGAGRVLAFAGDSTYRWYRRGLQAEHKRFWRQAVLWLAKKDETQQDEVWLTMRQRRFQPGARATFTVGAQDTSGEPVDDAVMEVRLKGPDGLEIPVSISRGADDWTGKTDRLAAGEYELIATATRNDVRLGEARGSFQVRDLDLELSDPAANPRQMQALAEMTTDVGGAFLASEQLAAELAALNEKLLDAQIEVESKWQLTDTNLDASALFGTLFVLLVLEWFLRKRWGMV